MSAEHDYYRDLMSKESNLITVLERMSQLKQDESQRKKYLYFDKSLKTLFQEFIDTLIHILNDLSIFFSTHNKMNIEEKKDTLLEIFFKEERIFYSGFLLVFIAIILYYIDSSDSEN